MLLGPALCRPVTLAPHLFSGSGRGRSQQRCGPTSEALMHDQNLIVGVGAGPYRNAAIASESHCGNVQ